MTRPFSMTRASSVLKISVYSFFFAVASMVVSAHAHAAVNLDSGLAFAAKPKQRGGGSNPACQSIQAPPRTRGGSAGKVSLGQGVLIDKAALDELQAQYRRDLCNDTTTVSRAGVATSPMAGMRYNEPLAFGDNPQIWAQRANQERAQHEKQLRELQRLARGGASPSPLRRGGTPRRKRSGEMPQAPDIPGGTKPFKKEDHYTIGNADYFGGELRYALETEAEGRKFGVKALAGAGVKILGFGTDLIRFVAHAMVEGKPSGYVALYTIGQGSLLINETTSKPLWRKDYPKDQIGNAKTGDTGFFRASWPLPLKADKEYKKTFFKIIDFQINAGIDSVFGLAIDLGAIKENDPSGIRLTVSPGLLVEGYADASIRASDYALQQIQKFPAIGNNIASIIADISGGIRVDAKIIDLKIPIGGMLRLAYAEQDDKWQLQAFGFGKLVGSLADIKVTLYVTLPPVIAKFFGIDVRPSLVLFQGTLLKFGTEFFNNVNPPNPWALDLGMGTGVAKKVPEIPGTKPSGPPTIPDPKNPGKQIANPDVAPPPPPDYPKDTPVMQPPKTEDPPEI